ncbi:DUF5107 domain-containing protein [Parabacteroides massiliensis]|uniref:DUF5107 domain-containing protein n=1 Tax=Parabacteroides massiliensis TaxID=1750560 RepID=UPI00096A57FA|nr:DUF5107 domain-containing protein [Parabacteroides massiliensis]
MDLKLLPVLLLCATPLLGQEVRMKSVTEKIPTYQIGAPEINPIFFTGRVYQGAEGYIYPYPLYDVLTEKKVEQDYNVLRLDNQYVNIAILPEIGGRIFAASDKTNDYPFFYTQTGVKPALIGMLGAWLSGGVEWNIPDHHRASSYMPINWTMKENEDGSKTIWIGETELRHRLKWSIGVSVYPNRSWVEAKIKVINPTPMIQSMLYWANVSVHCNDQYQVIFPPDVQFGADHHKVYFTNWPIGEANLGSGENTDLSWWKNFTENSRSIFTWGSKMSFLAGYDYGKDAGTVHVANRHVVPGKKFFLWGNNTNGEMWNKILSDNDGHYLELMVGGYSDNQPDYSWINPGEIREFRQIWYPIKGIKGVKNATDDAAVNFESIEGNNYRVGYCTTTLYENARVVVLYKNQIVMDKRINIDPDKYFLDQVSIPDLSDPSALYTALYDAQGNLLVDYRPIVQEEKTLPKIIDGTKPVNEYKTNEELYLAGLRIDQFNNARLDYMDFYNEALSRDSMDARINIEVGKHYIRQGKWELAEQHLLRAQARLSHDYTTVKNTEALYYLGYLYQMTGNIDKAIDAYWSATWTPDFKHRSFYELAVLAVKEKDYKQAMDMIIQSLYVGGRDLQALTLKAYILRMLGRKEEAQETILYIRQIDPLDYWSAAEACLSTSQDASFLKTGTNHNSKGIIAIQELLEVVNNYMTIGATEDALTLLSSAISLGEPYASYPLLYYYKAYNLLKNNNQIEFQNCLDKAGSLSPLNNYPFRVEEIALFKTLLQERPDNAFLHYHLGNLLYYLGQKENGLEHWLHATEADPSFAIAARNVGFGYGYLNDWEKSMKYYDRAIKANPNDPLLLTESDKIYEQANIPATQRLKRLEFHLETVMKHDDSVMRLLTLYNAEAKYDKAIKIMTDRHFHLWEGGGQVHDIYVDSHMLKGIQLLKRKQYKDAIREFNLANQYPTNLEVAPSSRSSYEAKVYYLSGIAYEALKQTDKALECFEKSAETYCRNDLADLNYYKIKSLRKLNKTEEADAVLSNMQKTLERMQQNLMDSYAKFGEANQNIQQSNVFYYSGLIHLLQNNSSAAKNNFNQAIQLYPGNIWAQLMNKDVH